MKNKRLIISLLAGLLALIMVLSLIVGILPQAKAASSSEIKEQIGNLESEQKDMQSQLEDLKAQQKDNLTEVKDIVAQKALIEQQVGLLYAQIDNINEQIAAYALLIADKQEDLDKAEAHLAELNAKYKDRIRAMEEDGSLSYWSVLFKASSFSDLLDRLNMMMEIAASDQRRLDEMNQAAREVEEVKKTLQEEKKLLEENKKEMAAKQAELDAKSKEAQELLATLLEKGEEYDALLDAQEEELAKLEQEIAQKQEEYDEAKYQEWLATSVPPTTKPPAVNIGGGVGGSASNTEGLTWLVPCDYKYVSSAFGWRWHPVHGDWRFHAGVDLAIGHTPIYATRAGIVETARYSESAGYYVVINHMDGYKSTYMHMCKFPSVKEGEMVTAGQVIGCVGSTGWSTGYHLHFGISQNGVNLNPMDFIG